MLLRRFGLFLLCITAVAQATATVSFSITVPAEAFEGPFSGKVILYLTRSSGEPRFGPDWFHPEPIIVQSFASADPCKPFVITEDKDESVPGRFARLKGRYRVQAVVDLNKGGREVGTCPGNVYSKPIEVNFDSKSDKPLPIQCDQVIENPVFSETDHVKFLRVQSKLLSDFYKRPTYIEAAIGLPEDWTPDGDRKFPVIYEVPGFGGTPFWNSGAEYLPGTHRDGESFIMVSLNADCPTGHCVFADSDTNGPWGKAFTTEFIPEVEKRFRGISDAGARYVTGHSSGGWSSLWLQVTYPRIFGGCWSTSPDPVDFRSFQGINIYDANANAFTDAQQKPRPLARYADEVMVTFKEFSDRERGLRGEQLGSFEAVFGPKGPKNLWDRDSGVIDPIIAKAWKRYDIGYILRSRWKELEPDLKGKIFIACGSEDTFYLEKAVGLLKKDLEKLDPEAVVQLLPGDHSSVLTYSLRKRIDQGMANRYRAYKRKIAK